MRVVGAFSTLPALGVLDLHADGIEWRQAVRAAKERGVPVLAEHR